MARIEATDVSEKGYSQVTTTNVGGAGLAFVSGQVARDEQGEVVGVGDFATQCRYIFDQLENRLQSVGSSLQHILKVTVFLKDFDDYATLVKIRRGLFHPEHPPASTAVAIKSLVDSRMLLEIEAVALVPNP